MAKPTWHFLLETMMPATKVKTTIVKVYVGFKKGVWKTTNVKVDHASIMRLTKSEIRERALANFWSDAYRHGVQDSIQFAHAEE